MKLYEWKDPTEIRENYISSKLNRICKSTRTLLRVTLIILIERPPYPVDARAYTGRPTTQLARVAVEVVEAGAPVAVPKTVQPNPPPPPPATASKLAPLRIHDPPPPTLAPCRC